MRKGTFEENSINSISWNIGTMKKTVYAVSVCDKISKLEPRLYWP